MGHLFGGTLTQLLLARGLGSTEGVRVNDLPGQVALPGAQQRRHRAHGGRVHPRGVHYAFTNTLTEEESRKVWDRYAIPAPGYWVWEFGLFANFKPGILTDPTLDTPGPGLRHARATLPSATWLEPGVALEG
jgi:hypothetical protein